MLTLGHQMFWLPFSLTVHCTSLPALLHWPHLDHMFSLASWLQIEHIEHITTCHCTPETCHHMSLITWNMSPPITAHLKQVNTYEYTPGTPGTCHHLSPLIWNKSIHVEYLTLLQGLPIWAWIWGQFWILFLSMWLGFINVVGRSASNYIVPATCQYTIDMVTPQSLPKS